MNRPEPIRPPEFAQAAPEARRAETFGRLALWLGLACIPAGLVFGILGLVKYNQAAARASADPGAVLPPRPAALVTSILGLSLPVLVWMSLIFAWGRAIAAQRTLAQDARAIVQLRERVALLQGRLAAGFGEGASNEALERTVTTILEGANDVDRIPTGSPEAAHLVPAVVLDYGHSSREIILAALDKRAVVPGQCVYAVVFPAGPRQPGLVAGGVRLQRPRRGRTLFVDLGTFP